ncbi:MAG: TonB-dependent receptor, partial [Flavobacteriaceae bacterium]|nr:TonB-dependent receptor [Flavobacteriaceae bacterium]
MKKSILVSCLLLTVVYAFSQEKKKDTLGTEEINVVRPYSPTVSDAFKIKSTPRINDAELNTKKQIRYAIFSVPVASTFTPAKGKAKVLRIDPSAPIYENYVSAGFGTFKTPVLEAFVHTNSTKFNDFGGFFNFLSSNGGVKDALLNTDFIDSAIDLFYNQDDRYYSWQITGGIRYQKYNWYGLPKEINFTNAVIDGISEKLNYTDVHLGGKLDYEDSFFQGGTASLYHFTDNEASSETHLRANPKVEFPVGDEFINATGRLEYLGGSFYTNYDNS